MTMTTTRRPLNSADVCDMVDVSYRQLDYWCRLGLVCTHGARPGSGSGYPRRFTPTEVRVVAALARLFELGAVESTLRHVAPFLRAMPVEEWTGYLLVDKRGAVFRSPHGQGPMFAAEAWWILSLDICARRAAA